MCTFLDPEIVAAIIGAMLGAFISGFVGCVLAVKLFKKTRHADAMNEFKSVFMETIYSVDEAVGPLEHSNGGYIPIGNRITDILNGYRIKHRRAFIKFGFHVKKKKKNEIEKIYYDYYNPLGATGTDLEIRNKSFSIYNNTPDEIEEKLKRKISGKDLAIENLKKIIDVAK
jgi:hypothetical protein